MKQKQNPRVVRESLLLGLRVRWDLMGQEMHGIVVESRDNEVLVACEGNGRLVSVYTSGISLAPEAILALARPRQDLKLTERLLTIDDARSILRVAQMVSGKSGLFDFSDHEERAWEQLVARAEKIFSYKRTP